MKKLKTLRDLLNFFRWNPDFDFDRVVVEYIDRPKGTSEFYGMDIEDIGHKFIYLKDSTTIPMHRIVRVTYDGEVWWEKV
ncbi:Uncharacterized protein conserved in archaea [Archaeoglobus sulfaticallidus PM70-1]|uniref:UPF0248 protein Asulf_00997 n=1 Tax=Archaeoglobus sulfaticallidus PM70-1 TaxID=387631 RepID=N0BKI5_9EURY|nr:DUF504 domain-containing protein [Archaeoglobus sulfaticallidus]AGK61001.1 Uncharacterized protein conserved in archaea [Archaeoglobus sulfaticallidus PM70-1]